MSYIESHQELGRHPKTKRLARLLSVSLPCAVGHLQFLWWWAMDYAQDGHLAKFDAYDIADAAGWEGDAEAFLEALICCGIGGGAGFVERDEYGAIWLHDWQDYGGKLFAERKKNAEKQARYRETKGTPTPETIPQESRNRNVTVTSPVTLKERRGEKRRDVTKVTSSPKPPQAQETLSSAPSQDEDDISRDALPVHSFEAPPLGKSFSPTDTLPTAALDLLTGYPEWWKDHLRLALVGRSPHQVASYACAVVREWRKGKNPPTEPLPEPGSITTPRPTRQSAGDRINDINSRAVQQARSLGLVN